MCPTSSLRESRRLDAINMSLSSLFCWVPRGQGQGDPTRHMVAIFHGCIPVFSLGQRRPEHTRGVAALAHSPKP